MADRHILYKIQPALQGQKVADAEDVETTNDRLTGALADAGDVQTALQRIDNTGLGAPVREITGSFAATYFEGSENTETWYGGRQTVAIRVRPSANGQYTFRMPDVSDMASVFDDLAARGLGEVFTITIEYAGGNTGFVNRNRLTVNEASVSNGFAQGTFPTVLAQGQSATFRLSRVGGVTRSWERLGIQQAVSPAPTFGEFVFQTAGWNNADGSFLPRAETVLKGYAFPVFGSDPNDGTLRQGLLDAGVSDRVIYDGDFVVWTADTFTSWTANNGDDWFVLPRNQLEQLTREEGNFLAQVRETDQRVDVGPVSAITSDALVWLSENPLTAAPFLDPSGDTNNPRGDDDYAYIGGREDRNQANMFQFGQNRFNAYMTIGITPGFFVGHSAEDVRVRIRDLDGDVIQEFNLATDFTLRTDSDFTNSTVRHYTRATSVNYPALALIEIVLTGVEQHFRLVAPAVDVTQNIADDGITEPKLSQAVRDKLNATLPDNSNRFEAIEAQLRGYVNVTHRAPEVGARFLDYIGTGAYPSNLSAFTQVHADSPRFTGGNVAMFVAVPEPGSFTLRNVTTGNDTALVDGPNVDVIESTNLDGVTYFVYLVTGLTSGHVYEVDRVTLERVLRTDNDIANLQDDIDRLEAEAQQIPAAVKQVLDTEVTVTEESNPTLVASAYNRGLGDTNAQTVFDEPSPNDAVGGVKRSDNINASPTARRRRKLLYFPAGTDYANQAYLTADNGTSNQELLRYANGQFSAVVRVPAVPQGSQTSTIYPAPATQVSGPGIWVNVPALTFQNGVPVPEADEVFFTRNVPREATVLTIQYRGHANGNVFGESSATLANVGGSQDAITTFTLNDGSETATVQVWYRASDRAIRVSVTESVRTGLPTINDIEVILSYQETRTVPAVPEGTREVALEFEHPGGQVFAFKASSAGNLVIVGDRTEVDTGFAFTSLFASDESGVLVAALETAVFYDYQDFDPIAPTVTDLENHATQPNFGLFDTQFTHETVVALGTQLQALDDLGNVVTVGLIQMMTSAQRTAITDTSPRIVYDTDQSRYFARRNTQWVTLHN
ncbi:hypothetical protein [Vibrio phage CKB-S1]|nr:hypothetical protein [Vibrio phage CKB-S1]